MWNGGDDRPPTTENPGATKPDLCDLRRCVLSGGSLTDPAKRAGIDLNELLAVPRQDLPMAHQSADVDLHAIIAPAGRDVSGMYQSSDRGVFAGVALTRLVSRTTS